MRYVFYVNTGNAPQEKAEEYLQKLREQTIKELGLSVGAFGDDKIMMVSVRNEPTRLEVLPGA